MMITEVTGSTDRSTKGEELCLGSGGCVVDFVEVVVGVSAAVVLSVVVLFAVVAERAERAELRSALGCKL